MSQAMAVEHDVDMTAESEVCQKCPRNSNPQNLVRAYIVIDTNILLEYLPIVQALFRVLSLPSLDSLIHILIPVTVLHGK
jgi:hypothetical protein